LIRLSILLRRELDRVAYAALFSQHWDVRVVGLPKSEAEALSVCRTKHPDATIIEIALRDSTVFSFAQQLLNDGFTRFVVLLGDEPNDEWKAMALSLRNATYLSRTETFEGLLREMYRRCDIAPPTRAQRERLVTAPNAIAVANSPHFATLSSRERGVAQLLVVGKSVKECAEVLGLAVSTVDNHKTRIMKKLNVHKTVDLVRLAIREGLVSP
jgi:DNA-binding NarL/FixJ family response regulator